ncbi:MAG: putative flippase GtrA [Bacteroidia bacterium]|jgi:putative flippase GtrA
MALYQTSKQIMKFTISGVIAVCFDFTIYYGLSNIFYEAANSGQVLIGDFGWNDVFKAFGFLSGTLVTYNLNKFWTWRQTDRNRDRLKNFLVLYAISFVINVIVNKYGLRLFSDDEIVLLSRPEIGNQIEVIAFKTDKLFAFLMATIVSSVFNFVGQKIWVFNLGTPKSDEELPD